MILNSIKKLSFKEVFGLIRISLQDPLFLFPTLSATKRCVQLCEGYFDRTHHLHNKANAFRHALWNLLVARKCYSWRKNTERVVRWTERVTNWHEDFSVNEPLARAMDLHNNKIGRDVFKVSRLYSEEEHVTSLRKMLTNAVRITEVKDLQKYKGRLVFISE